MNTPFDYEHRFAEHEHGLGLSTISIANKMALTTQLRLPTLPKRLP